MHLSQLSISATFIWYYSTYSSNFICSWTRKVHLATKILWFLPELDPRRTVFYFGCYSSNNAHVIILKLWKWLGFVRRSEYIVLVNGITTLLYSGSWWSRPQGHFFFIFRCLSSSSFHFLEFSETIEEILTKPNLTWSKYSTTMSSPNNLFLFHLFLFLYLLIASNNSFKLFCIFAILNIPHAQQNIILYTRLSSSVTTNNNMTWDVFLTK